MAQAVLLGKKKKLKGILASLVALLLPPFLEERQPQKIIAISLAKFEVDFLGLNFRLSIVSGCGKCELPEIVSAFQRVPLLWKTVISLVQLSQGLQRYKQACVLKNAAWGLISIVSCVRSPLKIVPFLTPFAHQDPDREAHRKS